MTEQEAREEFHFTDAEWREYQAMPDQGYSHRGKLEFFVNRWLASRRVEAAPSDTDRRALLARIQREIDPAVFDSWNLLHDAKAALAASQPVQVEVTDDMVERAAEAILARAFGQELPEAPIELARAALSAALGGGDQ